MYFQLWCCSFGNWKTAVMSTGDAAGLRSMPSKRSTLSIAMTYSDPLRNSTPEGWFSLSTTTRLVRVPPASVIS